MGMISQPGATDQRARGVFCSGPTVFILLCVLPCADANCAAGKYIDADTSTCSDCQVGMYSTQTNAAACTACEAGKYQANSASAYCTTCTAGSITDTGASAGATACTACGAGKYSTAPTMQRTPRALCARLDLERAAAGLLQDTALMAQSHATRAGACLTGGAGTARCITFSWSKISQNATSARGGNMQTARGRSFAKRHLQDR